MQRGSNVLERSIPARWGVGQRIKNTVIYGLVRVLLAVLAALPYRLVLWTCIALGHVVAWLPIQDKRRAIAHLQSALPNLPAHAIAKHMFIHLARCIAEGLHLERFLSGKHAVTLNAQQRALLDEAFAQNKGVVAITGHIGNWELCAQVFARAGYNVTAIAKPIYDPRLTRLVHTLRTQNGMQLIWRGDDAAGKDMLRVFKDNGMLALLIDQDTKVQGAFVPFFGKPAHTPTAAAALALRSEAPVIMAWGHRVGEQHVLHVERLHYELKGNREADVVALTERMTERLEAAIRLHPEQWVWMHRRWKKTPETHPPVST